MQIWLLKAVCLASCAIIYGKSNKGDNNTKVEEGPGRVEENKETLLITIIIKKFFAGFGDDINWTTWDKALPTAKALNKPVFLLIHKTWCGACQALKNEFKSSKHRDELVELAEKFVMTNTEDDEEPEDEKYAPDGAYIPRIFFLGLLY
ncbi:unnamed protein product [Thelazia callipaeda]|uniref:Thioredoxin domain-containing protein n=1 Tax=Thelazia callipaeda TaxID=103827 RepID=A0A0N5DA61_THECL|nr:unnamed protein product [Thelazia callipaeda]